MYEYSNAQEGFCGEIASPYILHITEFMIIIAQKSV